MRLCTQGCLFSIGGPKPIRQFFFDTGCPRLTHNSRETFPGRTGRRPSFWRGLRAPCVSFDELNTLGHVLAGQAHEPHSVEKTSGAASGCAHARHPQTPTAAQLLEQVAGKRRRASAGAAAGGASGAGGAADTGETADENGTQLRQLQNVA